MAVPFGFSVGDVIAAFNLIATSARAIRDGRGSSAEYTTLVSELDSLIAGLSAMDTLHSQDTAGKEHAAIKSAAYRCQLCIESFLQTIAGYQRWLNPGACGLRANIQKIRWAVCKKEDLVSFRNQLVLNCSSLNMLLTTLQVKQSQDIARLQGGCQQVSLTTRVAVHDLQTEQETSNDLIKGLSNQQAQMYETLLKEVCHLRMIVQLQEKIPAQVTLQKPVVLLDACGQVTPVHLDFVNSAEAFLAVLKIRFKQSGISIQGLQKLENAEYIFQDQRVVLSLRQPWQNLFKPGQHVNMSMVFRQKTMMDTCPGCYCEDGIEPSGGTECTQCGLFYRRVVEDVSDTDPMIGGSSSSPDESETVQQCTDQNSAVDGLNEFRRVQIRIVDQIAPLKDVTNDAQEQSFKCNDCGGQKFVDQAKLIQHRTVFHRRCYFDMPGEEYTSMATQGRKLSHFLEAGRKSVSGQDPEMEGKNILVYTENMLGGQKRREILRSDKPVKNSSMVQSGMDPEARVPVSPGPFPLQDYNEQLKLLEEQNLKRSLSVRREGTHYRLSCGCRQYNRWISLIPPPGIAAD